MSPFFSIVIPTYNRADLISATIESILAQSFTDFELIIVDDGSTDNTEEIIKPFLGDKVFYYKKKNEERAIARNYGTARAKGFYINWFDSDDIMLPMHLQTVAEFIKEKSDPEVVATLYELVYNSGKIRYKEKYISEIINDRLLKYNCVACNPVFVRRDIALQFPFNEMVVQWEDYELWLRLAARFKFYHINALTVRMIQHDQRGQKLIARKYKKMKERTDNFISSVKAEAEVRKYMGNRFRLFASRIYLITAYSFVSEGEKKGAFIFLLKSFFINPLIVGRIQFYSIIKELLFESARSLSSIIYFKGLHKKNQSDL